MTKTAIVGEFTYPDFPHPMPYIGHVKECRSTSSGLAILFNDETMKPVHVETRDPEVFERLLMVHNVSVTKILGTANRYLMKTIEDEDIVPETATQSSKISDRKIPFISNNMPDDVLGSFSMIKSTHVKEDGVIVHFENGRIPYIILSPEYRNTVLTGLLATIRKTNLPDSYHLVIPVNQVNLEAIKKIVTPVNLNVFEFTSKGFYLEEGSELETAVSKVYTGYSPVILQLHSHPDINITIYQDPAGARKDLTTGTRVIVERAKNITGASGEPVYLIRKKDGPSVLDEGDTAKQFYDQGIHNPEVMITTDDLVMSGDMTQIVIDKAWFEGDRLQVSENAIHGARNFDLGVVSPKWAAHITNGTILQIETTDQEETFKATILDDREKIEEKSTLEQVLIARSKLEEVFKRFRDKERFDKFSEENYIDSVEFTISYRNRSGDFETIQIERKGSDNNALRCKAYEELADLLAKQF